MPLSKGDRLGPYEILALVGQGGMGEVYRAHDDRLRRDVAIKISNAQFTERFAIEARAIAALNQTNICHLYDVGPSYLVMEYVEGEDLKGPLDFNDALPIIHQLIDGIEAAHEKNIVHRDLKPANIKITPDGVVKILDFGLAKATDPQALSGSNPANSPTVTIGATAVGTILGTAAYMAPEQAKGKAADKRSDIWSFGVVLYEMLTGLRLFQGESTVEVLGGVLNKDPDLSAAPARVHKLLRWCLEKDRKQRLASISDARRLLDDVEQAFGLPGQVPVQAKGLLHSFGWVAAALMAVTAAVTLWAPWRAPAPAPQLQRFEIAPPDQSGFNNPLQLSPDGRHLVFTSAGEGRAIWVRSLDTLQARKIAPWNQNPGPFWSPDNRFIAFQQDGKLKKVDITGGPPTTLCDAPQNFGGGAWNGDNVIVFGNRGGPLMQVPSAGGVPVALTKLDEKRGDTSHAFPSFLPDKKHFVYQIRSSKAEFTGIYIGVVGVPPEQQDSKLLIATANSAVYTPSPDPREGTRGLGFLLFLREQTLMAQPFDATALKLKGEPVPVAEQVAFTNYGFGRFSASLNGGLAFFTSVGVGTPTQLTWFDRQGKNLGTIGQAGHYGALAIAPDGSRVAAEKYDGAGSDLWLIDSSPGGKSDRFTFGPGRETSPVWSPDGSQIVFASDTGGGVLNLFKKPSNLAGKEEDLFKSEQPKVAIDWSRDGKTLSFSPYVPDSDAWTLNMSDKKATLFFKTDARDYAGRFSPDGHWLAYTSQVTGNYEVYVRPFPANESGGQQMVSLRGGYFPLWRRDGKELYYRSLDNKVMAVEVTPGAALKFGQPKPLFLVGTLAPVDSPAYYWDVTADGSRFLINLIGNETATSAPLMLVLNWTAGLK
jgi:serine/threonine protein kinase/Tol biopolymer transport system component